MTLRGRALDDEDGDLSAGLVWQSSLDGGLGSAGTIVTSTLRSGTHVITATVTDGEGLLGLASASLSVFVPNTPRWSPSSCRRTASPPVGMPALRGSASDADDGELSEHIAWTSSLDGALGTGDTLDVALRDGVHVSPPPSSTRAAPGPGAGDDHGRDPEHAAGGGDRCPVDGMTVVTGSAVVLSGTAFDESEGDLSGLIVWTSSLDGLLGTGATLTTSTLRPGTHVLSATVSDAGGLTGEAHVGLVVQRPNLAPVVTIVEPAAGTTPIAGMPLRLAGTALDDVDGNLGASLGWTSSLQGFLGRGATISAALAEGVHVLAASVADAGGMTGTATRELTVLRPRPTSRRPSSWSRRATAGRASSARRSASTPRPTTARTASSPRASRGRRTATASSAPARPRARAEPRLHRITADGSDGGGLVAMASAGVTIVAPTTVRSRPPPTPTST